MAESFASSSTQAGQTARPPTVPSIPVAIRTLGCKVNQVESEDIAIDLLGRGAHLSPDNEALVVVVNTCTVTGEADRKARKLIRQMLRLPQEPLVVVTGCMAAVDAEAAAALGDRVIVEAIKERVPDRVAALLQEAATGGRSRSTAGYGESDPGGLFHTRAMLKVQDGCDAFCTYCIVPHARGLPSSVPLEAVVARAEDHVSSGKRELVLTGVNIGRYSDTVGGSPVGLPEVISAVAATGIERLRLSSIEPMDITEDLLSALTQSGVACPHLHVPLQSGSDAVLRAMGRGYSAAQFEERIAAARSAISGLAVTTDVMAGFPGETHDDASATLELCARVGFAKMHVFRFSARAGTPAAEMANQVPSAVRSERAQALRDLGETMRFEFIDSRLGQTASVMVEETGLAEGTRFVRGTTGDYLRVRCLDCDSVVGEIVQVRLGSALGQEVLADPP